MNPALNEVLTRNLNTVWAGVLVRELLGLGVDHFYVSPGYRDAPLVAAITYTEGAKAFSCMDERAAAYRALGFAKATGKPAVLVCTSGTAGANYYPAVIEAYKDGIPLLVITADRPFELVHAGANQVIPQSHLYQGFTRSALSLPEPSTAISLPSLQQHLRYVWRAACGAKPGPVHVNMPFREPLEPRAVATAAVPAAYLSQLKPTIVRDCGDGALRMNAEAVAHLASRLSQAERGLLIIGRLDPWQPQEAVVRMAQALGWPVFVEASTGLRGELASLLMEDVELPAMRQALDAYAPDSILHVGKRLVSKWFDAFLAKRTQGHYVVVSDADDMQDETFTHDERWHGIPHVFCDALAEVLPRRFAPLPFPPAFRAVRQAVTQGLAKLPFSFLQIALTIERQAAAGTCVMVGNSTAVRAMGLAARGDGRGTLVVTRGVSGIEGHVATSLGLAEGSGKPAICLLGDVSLIHDLNSLLSLAAASAAVAVVVVNNGGGGIFHRLPLRAFPELMNPFITTPHQVHFAAAAALAGMPYVEVRDTASLTAVLADFAAAPRSLLVECCLEQVADDAAFDEIMSIQV